MSPHLSSLFHAVEKLELLSDDLLQAGETEQAIQAIQAAAEIQIQLLEFFRQN